MPRCRKPELANWRSQLPGLARRPGQDGQDVLGGRLGRVRVGQGGGTIAGPAERRLIEPAAVSEPEPAEQAEAVPDRVTEDDLRGQPLAELLHVLGQVGLLRVRFGRQRGESRDDPDAGLPERLGDLRVGGGDVERGGQALDGVRAGVRGGARLHLRQPGELHRLLPAGLPLVLGEPGGSERAGPFEFPVGGEQRAGDLLVTPPAVQVPPAGEHLGDPPVERGRTGDARGQPVAQVQVRWRHVAGLPGGLQHVPAIPLPVPGHLPGHVVAGHPGGRLLRPGLVEPADLDLEADLAA